MERLLRFLRGYVELRLSSGEPERFLNLCRHHKIPLWNLFCREDGYHFCVRLADFWELKNLVHKSRVRLTVLRKCGLPFWLYKNRRRKLMFAGSFSFFLLLWALSLFLWDIEFSGNLRYTEVQLQKFLEQNGYHCGMLLSEIGCEELEQLLRNTYPDITWVSAQIDGTRMLINIKENDGFLVSEEEDPAAPSDLIADASGTVASIVTREGTPQVTAGEQVEAGDVLISGLIDYQNDSQEVFSQKQVAADGDVLIETLVPYQEEFSMTTLRRNPLHSQSGFFFRLFGHTFSLFSPGPPKEQESQLTEEHQIRLFEDFYLPVYWGTIENTAYAEVQYRYSEEEAREEAERRLSRFLKNLGKKSVQISVKNVIVQIMGESCVSEAEVSVIFKASKRQAIPQENLLPKEQQTEEYEHD